jgi:cyclopropane-fatty-acyl-phospholipid synthase
MLVVKLISKFLTDGAITLIDHKGVSHHCGVKGRVPSVIVRLTNASIPWKLLLNPQIAAGEGYMNGEVILENGTLRDFMELIFRHQQIANEITWTSWLPYTALARSIVGRLYQLNSLLLSRRNVKHHYDIGNSMYEKFLGSTMQYSCAYFPPDVLPIGKEEALARYREGRFEDLDSAQRNKVAHLIRKLQIRDGMRILDVGCGWGGLAMEIARQANVEVLGISLSEEQIAYANRKAAEAGLSDRVQFKILDYRNLGEQFDRVVSVGMFEHVGKSYYSTFFKCMEEALKPEGIFVLHTIGRIDQPGGTNPWLRKYIFPGGYIPALTEIAKVSEKTRLILSDIEVLRLHYAFTLREWSRRFEESSAEIKAEMGDEFVRMWQFYLNSSEMSFIYGRFVNYQLQFVRDRFSLPITREYLC